MPLDKELAAKLHVMATEEEERLARHRAQVLQLPYVGLTVFPINAEVLELVPKSVAVAAQAVLFYKHGKDIRLGAINPQSPAVAALAEELQNQFGVTPQLHVISQRSLASALARYRRERAEDERPRGEMRVAAQEMGAWQKTIVDLQTLGEKITSLPPTEVLNALVIGAVQLGASDIHIEPKERKARLRYRVDGVLQDITAFDRQGWALVLSRVKVLAKLKLNVREVPQDGSFILHIGEAIYDMRVSILPGGEGEHIVIRLLNRASQAIDVRALGMKQHDYDLVSRELKRSNGMILVTGPTGSGKTTTLASFVREINSPDVKIITLEDPIEYRLPGVEQTQVDGEAGYTFAKGLRAILRQDPDVILVGEMRDVETAEVAIHAALTGHLVFSTLHTNDAAGAVPRLVDMGLKPFALAPAINLVIAQRLVRVVCPHCAKAYKPSAKLLENIRQVIDGLAQEIFDPAVLDDPALTFVQAVGCPQCGTTGYRGRQGLFEVFVVADDLEQLVLRGADTLTIKEAALKQGMTTITQDGYLKVIAKITTIEEVQRVTEE